MKVYTPLSYKTCSYVLLLWFLAAFFLLLPVSASAAVMPDFVRLQPVTGNINDPVAVALDQYGGLYVVESRQSSVVVLSQSGRYKSKLAGLDSPVSVAVDAAGRIFVGSKGKGNVAAYDSSLNPLFKLGSGDGEFAEPVDICVDVTGRIYVVDKGNDRVKIYDSSGGSVGSFGSFGNGDGEFNHPVSITVDEAAGEIIVLDRQIVPGTSREGSRIQFFNLSGAFLRSFTKNGVEIGDLFRPQDIAVDNVSRLYVTDSRENVVLVYDNTGLYLGAVFDVDNPFRAPLGITIGMNNRLYVASRMAQRMEVYGLDNYMSILVDPVRLKFSGREGKENPGTQSLSIQNLGNTAVNWNAVAQGGWLGLSEENGVLGSDQVAATDVAVDTTGLPVGEYTGSITVSAGPGAAELVRVELTVAPSARLAVAPAELSFASEAGTAPDPATITVTNTGSAPLHWSMYSDQPWIVLDTDAGLLEGSGAAPAAVTVAADVTGLAAGSYSGTITVTGYDALDSPAAIGVTLTLTEPAKPPGDEDSQTLPPGTTWNGNFGRKWTVAAQVDGISLNGIWGSSRSDIVAVGDSGTILHYDGKDWNKDDSGAAVNLNSIWGASSSNIYAVGDSGIILHFDGKDWTSSSPSADNLDAVWGGGSGFFAAGQNYSILTGTNPVAWVSDYAGDGTGSLRGIWGSSASDIYAVGDGGTILHNDGSGWQSIDAGVDLALYDVWGSAADDIYAVGQTGTILHYNGSGWSAMDSGTTATLTGIWGNTANEVYAVGEAGTMLLFQGLRWNKLETGVAENLNDAWGPGRKEIYAVGSDGSILYGKASFPWHLLMPALEHNGRRMHLMEK